MDEAIKLAAESQKITPTVWLRHAVDEKLRQVINTAEINAVEQRLMSEIGELREMLEAFMRVFLARVAQPTDKAAAHRAASEQFAEIRKFVDGRMNGNGNGRS